MLMLYPQSQVSTNGKERLRYDSSLFIGYLDWYRGIIDGKDLKVNVSTISK